MYPLNVKTKAQQEEHLKCLRNLKVGDIIRLCSQEFCGKCKNDAPSHSDLLITEVDPYWVRADAWKNAAHKHLKLPNFRAEGFKNLAGFSSYSGLKDYWWNFTECSPIYKIIKKR